MFSRLTVAAFILFSFISFPALAREPVPIINYDAVQIVTTSGNKPQVTQVEQAIKTAAAANEWTLSNSEDGKLLATLFVRNKHTVVVEITYDTEKYSLQYKDSINMKYGTQNGKPVIHPFYNRWVETLKEAIRVELLKL